MFTIMRYRANTEGHSHGTSRLHGLLKSRSTPSFRVQNEKEYTNSCSTSDGDRQNDEIPIPPSSGLTVNTNLSKSRSRFSIRKKISGLIRRDYSEGRDEGTDDKVQTYTRSIEDTESYKADNNENTVSYSSTKQDLPSYKESNEKYNNSTLKVPNYIEMNSMISSAPSEILDKFDKFDKESMELVDSTSTNQIYTATFRIHQKPFFEILRKKNLNRCGNATLHRPQHILRTCLDFDETLDKLESNELVEKDSQADFFRYFKLRLVEMRDNDMPISRCTEF